MKVAFAVLQGRLAPLFDIAVELWLVEEGKTSLESVSFTDNCDRRVINILCQLQIDTLVCGAISSYRQQLIQAQGIEVIAFVAGEIHTVQKAFFNGSLDPSEYAMPGCRRQIRNRCCGGDPQPHKRQCRSRSGQHI